MRCPSCGHEEDRVIESRSIQGGTAVRRRRQCAQCGFRFTSYEKVEERPLMVIKRDKRREPFDRNKVFTGIQKAVEKRPVGVGTIDDITDEIEQSLNQKADNREVASTEIGNLVMEKLHALDQVAYVRFASVYRQFKDVNEFVKEIKELE